VSTTTTTVPTSFHAVSSTATTATYNPPTASYSLVLTAASGDCWVSVTSGSTAATSKTLLQGQALPIAGNGTTTVTLGAPGAVSITLDHEPLVLPSTYQSPFVLTLVPTA
jgi:redox-sensitive bicupin YhaK (pirin superfamily)